MLDAERIAETRIRVPLIAALLLSWCSAAGHHSPAAFDLQSMVVVSGEVTRYDWKNPHVYIFVDGTDDAGQAGEWLVEADPTPLMARSGWTASTVRPGDRVVVRMQPDRDTAKRHGLLVSLTTTDGVTLGRRTAPPTQDRVAADISGVWDALAHFTIPIIDQDRDPVRSYTEAALRARAQYRAEEYPPAACLPFPTPMIMVLPYLNEIEILDDRVIIRSEFYDAERTIYTDGRGHPVDGRTIQGHSIGHWEGRALVVDTRLFADYRLAHGPGVPSGAQKHTVERLELSRDGTRLDIEIVIEDPEYVSEPYTVSTSWDYSPDKELESSPCDPENATFFFSR